MLKPPQLDVVILGLSITSSWGNGHATTYRCLVRGLSERGHRVLFLERDMPWYAANRDLRNPPFGHTELYTSLDELRDRHAEAVRKADLVIVGSYVPDGIAVGQWVISTAQGITAFYDIDTPVTLSRLETGGAEYLSPGLIPKYNLYLSFTGGPMLRKLEAKYGAPLARALYCSVDAARYFPEEQPKIWSLGYLGTYSDDRQGSLDQLLLESARRWPGERFIVAGPLYPDSIKWPPNVERREHLAPGDHRTFYSSQRFTLNVTRAQMTRAGYSPSVRLFEAAACATPIISDDWPGLGQFFVPGREILVAHSTEEVLSYLHDMPEEQRASIAARARSKTLSRHTGLHRAVELESYFLEASKARTARDAGGRTAYAFPSPR